MPEYYRDFAKIFDENFTPRNNNAILNVHSSKDDIGIDLIDPGNPAPGTTNTGFNDVLDMPRPNTMAEYMTWAPLHSCSECQLNRLRNYDIVFIIDDSTSVRFSLFSGYTDSTQCPSDVDAWSTMG